MVIYIDYIYDFILFLYRIDGDNYSGMGMYIFNLFIIFKYLFWNNYFKFFIVWYYVFGWVEMEFIWGN